MINETTIDRKNALAKIERAEEILTEVMTFADDLNGIISDGQLSAVVSILGDAIKNGKGLEDRHRTLSQQEFGNKVRTLLQTLI